MSVTHVCSEKQCRTIASHSFLIPGSTFRLHICRDHLPGLQARAKRLNIPEEKLDILEITQVIIRKSNG